MALLSFFFTTAQLYSTTQFASRTAYCRVYLTHVSSRQEMLGAYSSRWLIGTPFLADRRQAMFGALLRAPMSFFTATPLGRIMNRVSKDTADIDTQLASTSTIFVRGFIQILGVFVIIGMSTP